VCLEFYIKNNNLFEKVKLMGDFLEEWYGWAVILGIALAIGGLIFLFVVYPAFFAGNTIIWWIDIVGIIGGVALVIIGIIGAIAD
jgi:hypothetical protein